MIRNVLGPIRAAFRRAVRRDEALADPHATWRCPRSADSVTGSGRRETGLDMYADGVPAKSNGGVHAVPMALPVRRELRELKR
jgi:hypothetical protein